MSVEPPNGIHGLIEAAKAEFGIKSRVSQVPFASLYAVSADGHVISFVGARGQKIRLLRPSTDKLGYRRVNILIGGHLRTRLVHRIVAATFLPPPLPGQTEARHLDGNPSNCSVGNLAWGTPKENAADKVRHGTAPVGERHPSVRLSDADISEIRRMRLRGDPRRKVAERFGVHEIYVSRICSGERRREGYHVR